MENTNLKTKQKTVWRLGRAVLYAQKKHLTRRSQGHGDSWNQSRDSSLKTATTNWRFQNHSPEGLDLICRWEKCVKPWEAGFPAICLGWSNQLPRKTKHRSANPSSFEVRCCNQTWSNMACWKIIKPAVSSNDFPISIAICFRDFPATFDYEDSPPLSTHHIPIECDDLSHH